MSELACMPCTWQGCVGARQPPLLPSSDLNLAGQAPTAQSCIQYTTLYWLAAGIHAGTKKKKKYLAPSMQFVTHKCGRPIRNTGRYLDSVSSLLVIVSVFHLNPPSARLIVVSPCTPYMGARPFEL